MKIPVLDRPCCRYLVLSLALLFVTAINVDAHNDDKNEAKGPAQQVPITRIPSFGHALRDEYFLLQYTNFNHGSFGACPRPVLEYQIDLRRQQEEQPDPFLRNGYKQLWNETRVQVAQLSFLLLSSCCVYFYSLAS